MFQMKSLLFFVLQSAFALQVNVPAVDLKFWNDYLHVHRNNCYNYATNRITDSFAQPGEASGMSLWDLHCAPVTKAASADLGLTETGFFPFTQKNDESLIAVVVWPNQDYHWYRRGDDGMWSHKMGSSPATTLDDLDKVISSPETAERGPYTEFCGYFKIKNYIYQPNEQDGGLVRIGNMQSLPEEPPNSEVMILKYSGRPNPHFPLKDYLRDLTFKNQLLSLRDGLRVAPPATAVQVSRLSKLGYSGILIVDREGLIFPKGSRVQIMGTEVLAHIGAAKNSVGLTMARPLSLERELAR